MRILITGGAGFIGAPLASVFSIMGSNVLVVDDLSTGKAENLAPKGDHLELETQSITDPAVENTILRFEPDVVFHLAAQVSVLDSIRNPERDWDVNVTGGEHVLRAAIAAKAMAFIFTSTGIVYGDSAKEYDVPIAETDAKALPFPYSRSKYEFERILFEAAAKGKIRALTFRLGNVYGPRQNPRGEAGVVAIFSQRLVEGKPLEIHGDGTATRDYVYIGDVVTAFAKALNFTMSNQKIPKVIDHLAYNIGTGDGTNVNTIASKLEKIARGYGVKPAGRTQAEARPGEVQRIRLSYKRALDRLKWYPDTELDDGLKESFKWYYEESGRSKRSGA